MGGDRQLELHHLRAQLVQAVQARVRPLLLRMEHQPLGVEAVGQVDPPAGSERLAKGEVAWRLQKRRAVPGVDTAAGQDHEARIDGVDGLKEPALVVAREKTEELALQSGSPQLGAGRGFDATAGRATFQG